MGLMIPIGARIRFTHTIIESATGDHPQWLLAEGGSYGTVQGYISEELLKARAQHGCEDYRYKVVWDGYVESGFYASEGKDFTVCPSCKGTGVISPLSVGENLHSNSACPQCGGRRVGGEKKQ